MGNFKLLSTKDFQAWNSYLQKLPMEQQDIFFTPQFYSLYESLGDGKAQCFVFGTHDEFALYPFLINSISTDLYDLNCQYFDIQGVYGYNGVLTNSYNALFIDKFYAEFEHFCNQNHIISEFTRFHPLLENYNFSQKHLKIFLDRETVALNLSQSYKDIWEKEYSSKNRNMIRKAQILNYLTNILMNPSKKDIDHFISIYRYSMEQAGAETYYYFSDDFFYSTFALLKDEAYLFHVLNNDGQVVCSSIFLHYGDYFHYHLSGRTEKADNSVNNFILDAAIKFAQGKGAKMFHFGGGRSIAPNDSLLKFKSNFSRTRHPFYIGGKIYNHEVYNEVVKQWELKFPNKHKMYKNFVLKYRY